MNDRLNWMIPSYSLGRLFSTEIRVSAWFAILPLIVYPQHGLWMGLTVTAIMFVSVFLHEFGHIFAARWTGGTGDEILMTPICGLAFVQPANGHSGLAITSAAGPLVNLLICLILFPAWYAPESLPNAFNPLVLPISEVAWSNPWSDLGVLAFTLNWLLFLVNLLPVLPLDGGQILRAILSMRMDAHLVNQMALRIGLIVAMIILLLGTAFDKSQIVLLGTFVLTSNLLQLFQERMQEAMGISSLGYDFSSGYDSLERSSADATEQNVRSTVKLGPIQRWRERRRMQREQQELLEQEAAEQQLDSLLAKVHEQGLHSLSEQEKKQLRSCSELLQKRGPRGG